MVNTDDTDEFGRPARSAITLVVDPSRARLWHRDLAAELVRRGHTVAIMTRRGGVRQPAAIGLVRSFERLLQRSHRETPGSQWDTPADTPTPDSTDLVIDVTGHIAVPSSLRTLRPIYGETRIEEGAIATFLGGLTPIVGVQDSAAPDHPFTARVAVEDRLHLSRALDNIGARLGTMLLRAVERVASGETIAGTAPAVIKDAHRWRLGSSYRGLTLKVGQVLNRLLKIGPHWYVGWRRTDEAGSMVATLTLARSGWQRLADDGRRFYADPFIVPHQGRDWLFVEEFPYATEKGILSVVELGPDGPIGTPRPILETGSHLSYPLVFAHQGEMLMMPESSGARRVQTYRAVEFPYRWEPHVTLMDDIEIHDGTLLQHDDRWWLFGARGSLADSSWDNLHIWSADRLDGSWRPHARNPLVVSAESARPAGAFFRRGDQIWRPAQDCTAGYGSALALCRITRLDDEAFEQEVGAIIRPGQGWPGIGLHSLNFAGGIEVIDGCVNRRR